MPAYVVFIRDEMIDPAIYAEYVKLVPGTYDEQSPRLLAYDTDVQVLEGSRPDGVVIVELPSVEEARAHYFSERYQEIIGLRTGSSNGRMFIVEGVKETR
jgi:uncharacterized protein (DUF1330 family)